MNWQKQWIDSVLAQIPPGGYRKRLEAELRDHLDSQCRALMESGLAPDAAQTEALRAMGEPEKLKTEYQAAWQRTLESKVFGGIISILVLIYSCILMGFLYLFTMIPVMLVMDLFDPRQMWREPTMLYKAVVIACGCLTFLVPYTLDAAFLRLFCFDRSRHRAALITFQLLAFWAVSNWLLLLMYGGVMYKINQYRHMSMMEFVTNFYTSSLCSDLPWMTPLYLVLSILGCIVLGLVFGKFSTRAERLAAA